MNDKDLNDLSKAKSYAYRLLAIRPRSIKEIKEKLKKKGFEEGLVLEVIDYLEKLDYLNDHQFASAWVNNRISTKPVGLRKLRYELKDKGIDNKIIEEALNKLKENYNEYEAACDLAKSRMKKLSKVDRIKVKRRIFDYLLRRGFSYELVCEVMNLAETESRTNC
jgi:regulatory protein